MTETDWSRVERRRRAFSIIYHREGVSGGEQPIDVACRALQVGPTGIHSLAMEELEEGGLLDRLTEPWQDYERKRLRYLLGMLKRHPKKPPPPRLQPQPK